MNNVIRSLVFPPEIRGMAWNGFNQSTANTWLALAYQCVETSNLNIFRFRVSAVTGTPGSVVVTAGLYAADTGPNGLPTGSALCTATVTGVAAGSWAEAVFTGAGRSNIAGLRYWIILKATSAPTHYPQLGYMTTDGGTNYDSLVMLANGWAKSQATDGVPTWGTNVTGASGYLIKNDAGSWFGKCGYNTGGGSTAQKIYTGNEIGNVLISPQNCILNVVGMGGALRRSAGASNFVGKLYVNRVLVATSAQIINAAIGSGNGRFQVFFPAAVRIPPNTEVIFTWSADAGDSSTNYGVTVALQFDTVHPEAALYNASLQWARCNSGTWTFVPGDVADMCLNLDPVTPFIPFPLNRRKQINQR